MSYEIKKKCGCIVVITGFKPCEGYKKFVCEKCKSLTGFFTDIFKKYGKK